LLLDPPLGDEPLVGGIAFGAAVGTQVPADAVDVDDGLTGMLVEAVSGNIAGTTGHGAALLRLPVQYW
jgi:hypothetical protein